MKIFFRRIHLYLSLAAGLVILIVCLTGAILVFEKDLQMAINNSRYYTRETGQKLPAADLIHSVSESFPGARISSVKLYEDPSRTAEINITVPPGKAEKTENNTRKNSAAAVQSAARRQPGFTVFVDPYSGRVLEKYSYRDTFFYQVFSLHRWLLGSERGVGKLIVGVATMIFLFILLTGIILWWPKTKQILRQRLSIKSGAGWKRLNHDLHIVLGFYSAIFLFIFAFTGLAWSFEWFNKGIYKVTRSPIVQPEPPRSMKSTGSDRISLDVALSTARTIYPAAEFYTINLPRDTSDAIQVSVLTSDAIHDGALNIVYIDQYSGNIAGRMAFRERSAGARVRATFKPVHTGSIWGTPSKIIAFIVCLLGTTFPVTGFIMWLNRVRKKRKTKESSRTGVTAYAEI